MGKKLHYAWIVFAGCCLLQAGTLGMIYNCQGIFYTPVSQAFGFSVGDVALNRTLVGVGSCIMLPFTGRLLEKYDVRVTLTIASAVFALCTFLMGSYTKLYEWYVTSVIQGLAAAFLLFVPVPIILGRWFSRKTGTVMGLASAFAGVVGIIMNPVGGRIIETSGFAAAYRVFGIASAVVVLPATLFLLRSRPAEMGLEPYGYEPAAAAAGTDAGPQGPTLGEAVRSPTLYVMLLAIALLGYGGGACQSFTSFGMTLGMTVTAASALVSAAMAGNLVGKVGLGALHDKAGIKATLYTLVGCVGCGYVIMATCGMPALIGGAFLCGCTMAMSGVVVPILVKKMFGARAFASVYAWTTAVYTLINSFAAALNGYIYGAAGSYIPAWWMVVGFVCVGTALITLAMRAVEKKGAVL
ncbi:MAG: MFS transporter [Oscillospiraceae bacterium]|nr:MFS transporter [Oscillospiraceae bacterium]